MKDGAKVGTFVEMYNLLHDFCNRSGNISTYLPIQGGNFSCLCVFAAIRFCTN
jgi:hypothetical protein